MSVASHQKHMFKQRVQIVAVDPKQRTIQATLKDGAPVGIAVWEIPVAFRWPKVGEYWSVFQEHGYWMLDRRLHMAPTDEPDQDFEVELLAAGAAQIDATDIRDAKGKNVVTVDQSGIDNGDLLAWQTDRWVHVDPSQATGDQNLFIQATQPTSLEPYVWVQTLSGGDLTIWVEDGT